MLLLLKTKTRTSRHYCQCAGITPLPIDLQVLGMPGCWLYHDLFANQILGSGATTHALTLPNLPSMVGTNAFLQAWVHAPGINVGNHLTSNALELTFGY